MSRFTPKADILALPRTSPVPIADVPTWARGLCRPFDLAQSQNRREADKLFAAGYLATGGGRTFRGEDHSDNWRPLDVGVIKCDGPRKVGGRALRSRPQEAVPGYSTGKQQPPGLHEGAHPRCLTSMPNDACEVR